METKTSKGKEIRIPGPHHPITISRAEGRVRVTVAGRTVAESRRALRLEERGISAGLLLAVPRCGHVAAGSDQPLHRLPVQG
jgi:uncharacterized protein (DUF427 family)